MSEASDGKKFVHAAMDDNDDKSSKIHCFKQAKVAKIVNARSEGVRLRTEEGVPAIRSSFDPEDERMSRSYSDPETSDNLVNIYDAKGLFGDQRTGLINGRANKKANVQTMEERAQFFDPVFQSKTCGTNTLRTRFEAIQSKPSAKGEEFLSHFKNPLHKSNGKSVNDATKHEPKKEVVPLLPPKLNNSTNTKPLPENPNKPLPQTPNPQSPGTPKKRPPLVPKKPILGNGSKQEIGKKPAILKTPELPKKKQYSKESTVEGEIEKTNDHVQGLQCKSKPLAASVNIETVTPLDAVPVILPVTETEVCYTENANGGFSESVYSNVCRQDGEHKDMSAVSNGVEQSKTDHNKERVDWDSDNEPIGNLSDFEEDGSGDESQLERRISLETSDLVSIKLIAVE